MSDVRYEVTRDDRAFRHDWLNTLSARFPYTVYAYRGNAVYPRGWVVAAASTLRGARRVIRRDRERWSRPASTDRNVVHEEVHHS